MTKLTTKHHTPEAAVPPGLDSRLWKVLNRATAVLVLGLAGFGYRVNDRLVDVETKEVAPVLTIKDRAEMEKEMARILTEHSEKLLPVLLEIRDLRAAGYRIEDMKERIDKLEELIR